MKTATTKCVILGNRDFGEKNKLLFLYSADLGKIKAVAKGARSIKSRFTGHLETLNTISASLYFGPKSTILTELSTEKTFHKKDLPLENLTSALQIAGLTNELIFENQTIDCLPELLEKTIERLSLSQKPLILYLAYAVKLLDLMGKIPDFKESGLGLDKKFLKFFHFLKENDYPKIEKIILTEEENSSARRIIENLSHF